MQRLLAFLTTSVLIVAGCSASDGSEPAQTAGPDSSESAFLPPDGEEQSTATPLVAWQQALDDTRRAEVATVDVQLITNVEGFERIVAGLGYVELSRRFGDMSWTDELGNTREVITADGHFLELEGTWFEIEREGALPTSVAFDPLAGLADARNVVDMGTENVGGVVTNRLDADLNATDGTKIMGFSEEELTAFGDPANASLTSTIWVDADGRIVRILREYATVSGDGDPISATSLFLLDDLGEFRPIDVPETADAFPAPV